MNPRNYILSLLICFLTFSASAFSQDVSKDSGKADKKNTAIQNEILRLEELGRQKVVRGDVNWDDLIAENAYMIAFDGSVILYKKGQALPSLPLRSFELSEMIVRVYDSKTAVVTGLADVTSETPDEKTFSFKMRFLNVWKKSGDVWKITVSTRTGVKPLAKK